MKKKQIDKSWIYGVMVVTLTLALSILPIQAQVPDDLDGFAETGSITLYGGTVYPLCGEGRDRATCLDPATKDLFVILVPASPTKIPSANPLEYISNPMAAGGLGIAVHQIASGQANTSRQVTSSSTQKAMKITESADASKNPDILGTSNYGTPNGLDLATVYTQRIFNFIQSVCGANFNTLNCVDSTGVWGQDLVDKYVKHTIAHEAGHMMKLTRAYNSSYGGYHYAASTTDPLLIMAQSVKYVRDGSKVTFYLGVNFPSGDQTGALLK